MLKANNGGNNIVTANFNITDKQKTFSYDFATKGSNGSYARSSNSLASADILNDESLQQKGLIAGNDFTQVEFFLLDNTNILGDAAYLVNSSFYKTGNSTTK